MTFFFRYIIFVLLVGAGFSVSAQKINDTVTFIGNLNINKGSNYFYRIKFVIKEDCSLIGYSLTDADGPYETKTKIEGRYDSTKKEIFFQETKLLRSKVDLNKNELCYVKATLKFNKNVLGQALEGKFVGNQPNSKTECAKGNIRMLNVQKAMEKLEVMVQKHQDKQSKKRKQNQEITITNNEKKEINFKGNKIYFSIWDKGKIDGDEVSIMLNDKYILKNYKLDSTVKKVEYMLTKNEIDTVKIIALNEGLVPPNSSTIKIESETEAYPIQVEAVEGETKYIYLRKKK